MNKNPIKNKNPHKKKLIFKHDLSNNNLNYLLGINNIKNPIISPLHRFLRHFFPSRPYTLNDC